LVLAGCGGSGAAPPAAAEPSPEPAAAKADAPAPAPTEPEEPPNLEAPAASNEKPRFDLDYWASEHQIQIDLKADGCELAELGDKPDDVIWCNHHTESAHVTSHTRALYAVRGKQLVKLIEIAIGSAPLIDGGKYNVKLEIVRQDATHVEVKEASDLDCERVKKENEDICVTKPEECKERVAAAKKVCAARGRYEWVAGTLRKR
jgi:hypothetical protein